MRIKSVLLKDALLLISSQSDEFDILANDTGWNIYALSPDRTSMSVVDIPYTAFDEPPAYDPDSPMRAVLDCSKVLKALRTAGSDTVDMEIGDKAVIKGGGMTVRIPTIEPGDNARRFPDLDFGASAMIGSPDLTRIVKAAEESMALDMKMGPAGLSLSTHSEAGETSVTLDIKTEDCLALEGEAKATYPLKALRGLVGALPKSVPLTLSMSDDYPIIVSYATEEGLAAKWLAAPWVCQEDD